MRSSDGSVPQGVRFVAVDRGAEPEEGEDDGQADGGLGSGHGDDEEGEHLAVDDCWCASG